jgi:hypothetical protein
LLFKFQNFTLDGVKYASGCEEFYINDKMNRTIELSCDNNEEIVIIKGDFGRVKYSKTCDDNFYTGEDCSSEEETTSMLRTECDNKVSCSLEANIVEWPDKCIGVRKQLRVWYQCIKKPSNLY